ncbi:hypothetical protein ACIBTV_25490 [Micromonospora sp. NPDC049366]|uniref:hypothetical protein n=1 Tax=Micromonospora sp. NPDC049366 TaxID=3364271 RepID=UPI0037B374A0
MPVWSAIITHGGLIPADAAERERYERVQAVMRLAFGLPERAPLEQLIDAQSRWRGNRAALAGRYLRAYAERLDPRADLDDIDRAALPWRGSLDEEPVLLAPKPDPWGPLLRQLELFPEPGAA